MKISVDSYWIRKRDKTLVSVHSVKGHSVQYATHPMLEVWPTTRTAFVRNFRVATASEIERGTR